MTMSDAILNKNIYKYIKCPKNKMKPKFICSPYHVEALAVTCIVICIMWSKGFMTEINLQDLISNSRLKFEHRMKPNGEVFTTLSFIRIKYQHAKCYLITFATYR